MPRMIQEKGSPLASNGNPNNSNSNSNSNSYSNSQSPPLESFSEMSLAMSSPNPPPWISESPEMKAEERGLRLIELLGICGNHVSSGNMEQSNLCMEQISSLASLTGDPMQRLATYFLQSCQPRDRKSPTA